MSRFFSFQSALMTILVVCVFCRTPLSSTTQETWNDFTRKVTTRNIVSQGKASTQKATFREKSRNLYGDFSEFPSCAVPTGATLLDLPDSGLDFEMEVQATDSTSNMTYKAATFSDGLLQRGVVALDYSDRREIILYDILSSTTFHVRDHTCTAEPLSRTLCNPLSYFLLRSAADRSAALASCKFEISKPVLLGLNLPIRGSAVVEWQQCLRLSSSDSNIRHNFYMKSSFRISAFTTASRKYIPMRLSIEPLTKKDPHEVDSASSKPSTSRNNIVFDFISFRSRLKNRSIFQAKEYANCSGWKKT